MHQLPAHQRILLLTEGHLGVFTSKTAAALLRYRPQHIVGLIDSQAAGQDVRATIPWSPALPICPNVTAATHLKPDVLVIGIAPVGGALPPAMRKHVADALQAGIDVLSGLHAFLADDEELIRLAARSGAQIFDLRRPPANKSIATGAARNTRCRRILTVGTDCNVGKLVTAIQLTEAARERGLDARLLATGQTGILIAQLGVAIDACIADFAAGAAEQLVLESASADVCFIEGQGSLAHPGYSAVTLALMHGTCPDAMILVHEPGRTTYKAPPHEPLPPLNQLIAAYEQVAALRHPARVVGLALNTVGLSDADAYAAATEIEATLNLPALDPVRHPCDRLLDALAS